MYNSVSQLGRGGERSDSSLRFPGGQVVNSLSFLQWAGVWSLCGEVAYAKWCGKKKKKK